ncbi:hypothetical protein CRM22_003881 [Opisthorchis felineus]|uniref:Uncharacterized protein n=2 Tax=Opisthorchis felineus TaxID=147828 RepID=A0A4S2LYY2_OPIFE|nr:hypothetical protein CRM22_003881 [Opisthorchis felineus]
MGKGYKKRSSSSSSSSSSDGGRYNPNKMYKKRAKYEAKMRKAGRCICRYCPPGVMACPDNFMRRYQHHGMAHAGHGAAAMYGPSGSMYNYPPGGAPYVRPGMMPSSQAQYPGGMMQSQPYGSYGPAMTPGQPGMTPGQPGMMPGMPSQPYPQSGMPGQMGQMPPYSNAPGMPPYSGMPGQPPFYYAWSP